MNIRSNPDTTLPAVTTGPLPSSRKIFVTPDEAPDLRVPLREIILSKGAGEPDLPVYDTSGPSPSTSMPGSSARASNGSRSAAASRNIRAARSSRRTMAMSALRTPRNPSPRITSRCAGSTAT